MPVLTLESRTLRPDHIRAIWPAEQGLASPVERLTIEAATMTSELDLQPSADFALDASDTILHGVTVSQRRGLAYDASRGPAQHDPAGRAGRRYDVTFAARNLAPPDPVRAQLDPGGILPGTIETLDYSAEMEFDRPWDIRAIEERRPQITALDLGELNAVWGGLILRAAGDVDRRRAPAYRRVPSRSAPRTGARWWR
jgi:hypothetical protein